MRLNSNVVHLYSLMREEEKSEKMPTISRKYAI